MSKDKIRQCAKKDLSESITLAAPDISLPAANRPQRFRALRADWRTERELHQRHEYGFVENADFQLLELPYSQSLLSMVVMLPRRVDGLAQLEQRLNAQHPRQWFSEIKSVWVDVTLPKFTFSAEPDLADTLPKMGINDAFDPRKADFSGISHTELFVVSAVNNPQGVCGRR